MIYTIIMNEDVGLRLDSLRYCHYYVHFMARSSVVVSEEQIQCFMDRLATQIRIAPKTQILHSECEYSTLYPGSFSHIRSRVRIFADEKFLSDR